MTIPKLSERYVADRIKQLMRERKLTLLEFAQKVGLNDSTLKHILEGSNNPQFRSAIKIAEACKVSLDWLCTERDDV